ncbi:hypothetical protein ANCDUO_03701 [Ancylostoma duodenale]|uniref:Uncharacterized protein n=1 Tax=Ancylostoma duodenale TaxID=51022 RepID=A0A0C2H8V6_9BILA|nr:hypothetical protein ANCDUO_03701 [Ancylostoma duodenale]
MAPPLPTRAAAPSSFSVQDPWAEFDAMAERKERHVESIHSCVLSEWIRIVNIPNGMRKEFLRNFDLVQRMNKRWRMNQHELGHEHRFVRTANNPNRTFATEKMWINTGLDNLRRLCSNIQLRR